MRREWRSGAWTPVSPTAPPRPSGPWHWAQLAVKGTSSLGGPNISSPYSISASSCVWARASRRPVSVIQ
jgi:hypothetical protein